MIKLSNYKQNMLKGFILSCLAIGFGALWLKFFPYPALAVPFILGGGLGSFFFALYFIGEYEEDLAEKQTLMDIAQGHVNGLEVQRTHNETENFKR